MLENRNADKYTKAYETTSKAPKETQTLCDVFIGEANKSNTYVNWGKLLGTEIQLNKMLTTIQKIKEIKLKWFQMKICHKVLVSNSILMHMEVISNNICNLCQLAKDTMYHYMWQSVHSQAFWTNFF